MAATSLKLFGMGNPLLDISSVVGDEVFKKYEVKPGDIILAEEKHQGVYPELMALDSKEFVAGGATQNSIRVAQWMSNVPGSTTYTGSVGEDEFSKLLREAAAGDGVDTPYYVDAAATGTCAVLVKDHERALIANLSAANNFKLEHLEKEDVWAKVTAADIYYSAGFFLTVSVPSLERVGQHAAENNKIFCMNISAPFLCQFFKDQMMTCLPYTDILFGNETEAVAFSEAHSWGTTDTTEIAKKLQALPKTNTKRGRTVVITHGGNAAVVVDPTGAVSTHEIKTIEDSKIVDVNGAGDAFVGGFLAQLMAGKSLKEQMAGGMHAAWVIIQRSGCTIPKEDPVTDFSASA